MHAVDLLDLEAVHQPVLDHRLGAGAALFGGLEDHHRIAGEIARLGEIARRAQQHRGVAVMTAGMHLAGRLRGIRHAGGLEDRQRVHVGTQADHLDIAVAGRPLALDDADDAGLAHPGHDLVTAEFPQPVSHECCSAVHVIEQFRMLMNVAAPGGDIGVQIGDAVDDGHGSLLKLTVWVSLASKCVRPNSPEWHHSPQGRHGRACPGHPRLTIKIANKKDVDARPKAGHDEFINSRKQMMPRMLEGDFDYIVVGAGTAGCILANRLSADPTKRVLILEAGGKDNWIWFHIPVGYLFAIGNPRSDWMFKTESEPGLNGRALAYPRGKVIGGCSAINAMISMRGQAADYNYWRQLGLKGWAYDDVLPVFRRLEDHFLGDSEHHGAGGGWRIEAPRLSWDILDAVGEAAQEMGVRKIPDFNTGDNEGVSYFHVNQKRGRRWSSARGFLKPALNRPNLRLETHVHVERLIIERGRAAGVRFIQNGEVIEARAKGEVILCAGAIGSIQVLHRSGIGPGEWLSPLGIDVVLDRPGVGRNLQDHLQQRAIYKVEGVKTLNETYYSLIGRG